MANRNPIATADQHAVERRAIELLGHPELRRTMKEVRDQWLKVAAPSEEMRERFDEAFGEVMFCATVWSLNQDPQRPMVITITRLAHRIGDVAVPGSRYGLDNPDSVYRVIPISGTERYVIRGRVPERRLTENYFTLWDQSMHSVAVFNGNDLILESDRSFIIEVDSDPRDGRKNHIRSSAGAHEFYIRDVLLDWEHDRINELFVEKLGPSQGSVRSEDDQIQLTARFMKAYAENTVRWNDQALQRTVNDLSFTIDRDTDGALRNQLYILGHFHITDEEALVIDVHIGGAQYFIAPITNIWGTTNDIVARTGSLNLRQLSANPDGTYTIVIAMKDPGVHNWLDPCGLHEGILTLRWAEFPKGVGVSAARASSRVVSFEQLHDALPAGTCLVTSSERSVQLAHRTQNYSWRLGDH